MSFTGRKHSPETKARIAASMKQYKGTSHPKYGTEWSAEQRDKYNDTIMNKQLASEAFTHFLVAYQANREAFRKLPIGSKMELFLKHYQNTK